MNYPTLGNTNYGGQALDFMNNYLDAKRKREDRELKRKNETEDREYKKKLQDQQFKINEQKIQAFDTQTERDKVKWEFDLDTQKNETLSKIGDLWGAVKNGSEIQKRTAIERMNRQFGSDSPISEVADVGEGIYRVTHQDGTTMIIPDNPATTGSQDAAWASRYVAMAESIAKDDTNLQSELAGLTRLAVSGSKEARAMLRKIGKEKGINPSLMDAVLGRMEDEAKGVAGGKNGSDNELDILDKYELDRAKNSVVEGEFESVIGNLRNKREKQRRDQDIMAGGISEAARQEIASRFPGLSRFSAPKPEPKPEPRQKPSLGNMGQPENAQVPEAPPIQLGNTIGLPGASSVVTSSGSVEGFSHNVNQPQGEMSMFRDPGQTRRAQEAVVDVLRQLKVTDQKTVAMIVKTITDDLQSGRIRSTEDAKRRIGELVSGE